MSAHTNYLRNSATYASLHATYGPRLTMTRAEHFAAKHCTTVADLIEDAGLVAASGTVSTLALVQALGY